MTIRKVIIATLLLAALVAGLFLSTNSGMRNTPPPSYRAATVLPAANDLPDFQLHDQFGNAVNGDTFLGQWHLMFFGFTNCPDICPTTLQHLSRVKKQLAENGVDISPRIALVSVDPERDTAELIGQYVNYFGDDNLGITGDLTELQKLTAGLGIYFAKQPAVDDTTGYNVDHSAAVLLLDPQGKFHALISGSPSVDDYVHDLALIFDRVPIVATRPRFLQAMPGSAMSVGYLTLSNRSDEDIVVSAVTSEDFDSVQLHETAQQDGVAKMRQLEQLVIPARSSVDLREGGIHLMFHVKRGQPIDTSVVGVTFHTDEGSLLRVTAALKPREQP